jgi:hypothetical protein
VAEEDLHCGKRIRVIDNEVNKDDGQFARQTYLIQMRSRPPPMSLSAMGPSPSNHWHQSADENVPFAAANDQAKLMQWHYHLGHLSFQKLKQIALNGKIPKKLLKLKPPKCADCLFGMMTKLPWCGKELESSHKVFFAPKLGGMGLS